MSKETLEEISKTKSKLDYLMQQRKQAMEREDYETVVRFQAEIDALKIKLGVKAGAETTKEKPPTPEDKEDDDIDARVVGAGYKLIGGDPDLAAGPRVWFGRKSRDTKLSVGDLVGCKQGEEKEGDNAE